MRIEKNILFLNNDNYTSLFIDLIDDYNQEAILQYVGYANDNVYGYSLGQLQTVLQNTGSYFGYRDLLYSSFPSNQLKVIYILYSMNFNNAFLRLSTRLILINLIWIFSNCEKSNLKYKAEFFFVNDSELEISFTLNKTTNSINCRVKPGKRVKFEISDIESIDNNTWWNNWKGYEIERISGESFEEFCEYSQNVFPIRDCELSSHSLYDLSSYENGKRKKSTQHDYIYRFTNFDLEKLN